MPSIALTLYIHHFIKYSQPHCEADTNIIPALPVLKLKRRKIKCIDGGPTAQNGKDRTWTRDSNNHTMLLLSSVVKLHISEHSLFSLFFICSIASDLFFCHYKKKIRLINERKNHNTCSLASHIKPFSLKISTES